MRFIQAAFSDAFFTASFDKQAIPSKRRLLFRKRFTKSYYFLLLRIASRFSSGKRLQRSHVLNSGIVVHHNFSVTLQIAQSVGSVFTSKPSSRHICSMTVFS
jgi:hypothetical protein